MNIKAIVAGLLAVGILAGVFAVSHNVSKTSSSAAEVTPMWSPGGGGGGGNGTF